MMVVVGAIYLPERGGEKGGGGVVISMCCSCRCTRDGYRAAYVLRVSGMGWVPSRREEITNPNVALREKHLTPRPVSRETDRCTHRREEGMVGVIISSSIV